MRAVPAAGLLGFALLACACASLTPEEAARRDAILSAATECRHRHPYVIAKVEVDRFGRLVYYYWENASGSERETFLSCVRERLEAK